MSRIGSADSPQWGKEQRVHRQAHRDAADRNGSVGSGRGGRQRRMRLTELGERICIIGPSNSGKSTLAEAIARKLRLKAIHLDQLHHLPNTNWKPRPADDFAVLHDEAVGGGQWVIDGNYSKYFPERFRRATGVILLDVSTVASLFRYVRRTVTGGVRAGALEGGQDSLKLNMFHHIAVVTPRNRKRYAEAYGQLDIPKICLPSVRAIDACYRDWGLERTASGAD